SIEASEEAIARGSDSPWTFNNIGYAYLVLGKTDDAVRELEKAVSFDTGVTPSIWNNLGLAYEKKGELADAANAYRAALAGNPGYVKAKVNLKRLTEVARANGVAIGERSAEVGAEVKGGGTSATPAPTPAEIEGAAIGEKVEPGTNP
ncbi:MAG TPA: tetratricopeptide repeat protein, partial [bacterium]|nr:tetratricopeptide repeat protein [bacterium]